MSHRGLYEPLDFFVVRAPLLPVEAYHELSRNQATSLEPLARSGSFESGAHEWVDSRNEIRRALAVGSVALLDASHPTRHDDPRQQKVEHKLLRYMIRMSTRPTPFGLFAGVALGRWDTHTNLQLSTAPRPQRTRPDMGWLMSLVLRLEALPEVRRHLRLVANPAALIRAGRVFLTERVSRGEPTTPPAVSIRATGVVRRALVAAREPVPYETLASLLLSSTNGATPEKVEKLLAELWEQTLLLTDLGPPLTSESPVRYVIDRLHQVPAATHIRSELQQIVDAAAAWDRSPHDNGADRYRTMVREAATLGRFDRSPFQVDAAVLLTRDTVSGAVGDEAARAAAILLRMSPTPRGPVDLAGYRRVFTERYGVHREVALLELLDPNVGLGPPWTYGSASTADGLSPAKSLQRNHALLELAAVALRQRRLCVDLDEPMLQQLETWEPSAVLPASLDLYVSVSAESKHALDAGDFRIVVGPTVGALAAGRTLGRFSDLVPGAEDALRRTAAAEEALEPHTLWAELTYQPRLLRLGNVSIRPNVRKYEIAVGVAAGRDADRIIPLDELVVGVRDDRFYIHWPAAGHDVAITVGHMLTHVRAPIVCRFLSEVSRDGCCQLTGFQWGLAAALPFLPRVEVGRIVLSLARWRLAPAVFPKTAFRERNAFLHALGEWREQWQVPHRVYLSAGDNRLLLDLSIAEQADEIRLALQRLRGESALVLTEVLPDLQHAWVQDSAHRHFMTELVVPLVRRQSVASTDAVSRIMPTAASATSHRRSVGSEWLFAKLYGGRAFEDDLLVGPVRSLIAHLRAAGIVDDWFFLRYSDPERHLRLRFRGRPESLLRDLLPALSAWANARMQEGVCRRFVLDTYEREIERFGGEDAMTAAETFFAAESLADVDLLELERTQRTTLERIPIAVLTVDAVLEGLGLDAEARFHWCRSRVRSRHEASREYRQWKGLLRSMLGASDGVRGEHAGAEIADVLVRLRTSAATLRDTLNVLHSRGELTRPLSELHQSFVHLHLNRLLGGDQASELLTLGLLWRVREGLHRSPLI